MLVGLAINFLEINPTRALVLAAPINAILSPPLLVLLLVANKQHVMGSSVNGRGLNLLGWVTVAIMATASICLIVMTVVK